jgi:hypothetical protein
MPTPVQPIFKLPEYKPFVMPKPVTTTVVEPKKEEVSA